MMPNPLQSFAEAKAPPRNKLMGLVADALTRANEFATMQDPRYGDKRQNQTLGILADVLGLGSIAKTADRLSYGDPLTNAKKANVPFLKPETADALMMAPISPRTALAAIGMGMGDNALTRAATVWHGSPHKFDKFDASKIGTGEGAQAYGHGLYLAESPDVAKSYMRPAGRTPSEIDGKNVIDAAYADRSLERAARYLQDFGTPDEAIKWSAAHGDAATSQLLRNLVSSGRLKKAPDGEMYKVDLPDEKIARMLDWDKPLSQQAPEVNKALQSMVSDVTGGGFDLARASRNVRNAFDASSMQSAESLLSSKYGATKTPNGWIDKAGKPISQVAVDNMLAKLGGKGYENAGQLYNDLSHVVGSQRDISATLRNNGIPGIRYLDGGSRGAGAGSSNYVVFPGEEEALKILERNGIPVR
jgi:hypothetical protein